MAPGSLPSAVAAARPSRENYKSGVSSFILLKLTNCESGGFLNFAVVRKTFSPPGGVERLRELEREDS